MTPDSAGARAQIVLRGHLVTLRSPTALDGPLFDALARNPFIERMVGSELLEDYRRAADREAFCRLLADDPTQLVLVICALDAGSSPLGLVRLFQIHPHNGYAFLEAMLADPRALRKGFGVEAGRLICCYGVDVLRLARIEAKVYAYNRLSVNALLRNRFRLEGVLRHARFFDGAWHDVLVFGLLKEELETGRKLLPLDRTVSLRPPERPRS
jgi:RimJ/RimL family protein N-acetyltransferase